MPEEPRFKKKEEVYLIQHGQAGIIKDFEWLTHMDCYRYTVYLKMDRLIKLILERDISKIPE